MQTTHNLQRDILHNINTGQIKQAAQAITHAKRNGALDEADLCKLEALLLWSQKTYMKAYKLFQKCLAMQDQDNDPNNYIYAALCMNALGHHAQAIEDAEAGLKVFPQNIQLLNLKAMTLQSLMRHEEAIACLTKTLDLIDNSEDKAQCLTNLASFYLDLGNKAEAQNCLLAAINAQPDSVDAHYLLSGFYDYEGDPDNTILKTLLGLVGHASDIGQAQAKVHFALGRAMENLEDYPAAFDHFTKANAMIRRNMDYDTAESEKNFERIKNTIYKPLVIKKSQEMRPVPIFIVGMPRSGTTLVEQILGAHTNVFQGGEMPLISKLQFSSRLLRMGTYDSDYMLLDDDQKQKLREAYRKQIAQRADNIHAFITDKMPFNFRFIGFIKDILPEAKIIHCARDPRDTCISIYRHLFNQPIGFAYDLKDIIEYLNLYSDLMAFWSDKYTDSVYSVQYEQLIATPDLEIKKLLEYIGLSFDKRCLGFHERENAVLTASQLQVKKPIYSSSIQNWKKYDFGLNKFIQELK